MKMDIPKINQKELLDVCIDSISDKQMQDVMNKSKRSILELSEKYTACAENGVLYTLDKDETISGGATNANMQFLYEESLVNTKGGRIFYEKIKKSAPWEMCPICEYNPVKTVDHYLPKSVYYQYAVTIANLVPACADCNKEKQSYYAKSREGEIIHPYFDDFDDEIWLYASINKDAGNPFGFSFEVKKPLPWDDEKYNRIKNHFYIVYKLDKLYTLISSREVNVMIGRLVQQYKRVSDTAELRELIALDCKAERGVKKNSWKAAIFQCIYDSNWFWDYVLPTYLK